MYNMVLYIVSIEPELIEKNIKNGRKDVKIGIEVMGCKFLGDFM